MNEPQPALAKSGRLDRLLVPLDGSRLAEASLAPASAIARARGTAVTLLHVVEQDAPSSVHGERHLRTSTDAEAYLQKVAARFATDTHVTVITTRDTGRGVSAGIINCAREVDAGLVVIASHGAGGVRGLLFGRVAQHVVRRGALPALVSPVAQRGIVERPFVPRAIAVAMRSAHELAVVQPLVTELARAFAAGIHLISVVPTPGTLDPERAATATLLPSATRAVMNLEEERARNDLERAAASMRTSGLAVTTAVIRGEPAEEVIAEAIRADVDLLTLATHARHGLAAVWMGSVGTRILGRYEGRLLLVPALS